MTCFALNPENSIRKRNHCPNRRCLGIQNKNGTFAEFITLPLRNLHLVPDNISDEEACFTEPLAAAYRIIEQNLIKKSDKIAIIGDGKLGLLIAEVMIRQNFPNKVVMIGKHEEKMNLLPENLILPVIFDQKKIESQFENTFDVTIACSASLQGFRLACAITKPLGKVVLKTTCSSETNMSLNEVVIKELQIVGSRCGPFEPAINLLKNGEICLKKYISRTFPFEEMEKAFDFASQKGVLKIQVLM